MSFKYEHTADDWLRHKNEIRSLYVDLNWKLDALMKHMEATNNFFATPQQYKKKFKNWGLAKSMKKSQWSSIAAKVIKRQQNGKDSLVTIGGRVIGPKRLRSAMARYGLTGSGDREVCPSETNNEISIRTPRPGSPSPSSFAVDLGNSGQELQDPMDTFLEGFEAGTTSGDGGGTPCAERQNESVFGHEHLDDAINHPWASDFDLYTTPLEVVPRSSSAGRNSSVGTPSLDSMEILPQSPSYYIDWRFHKVQTLPFFKFQQTLENFGLLQIGGGLDPEMAIKATPRSSISASPLLQLSLSKPGGALTLTNIVSVHARLFQILFHRRRKEFQKAIQMYDAANLQHQGDVHQCLTSTLKGFLPERCEGDLSNKVDKLLDPARAIWQLLEIVIYLTSNHLVDDAGVQLFLALLNTTKCRRQLIAFMKVKAESVQAITDRVIDEAIKQDSVEVIHELHIQGLDFDDSQIAACCCRTKDMTLAKRLLRSRNSSLPFPHDVGCQILNRLVKVGTLDVVELAIKVGANPNNYGCAPCRWATQTLHEAIQRRNLGMVRLLLDYGVGSSSKLNFIKHSLTALSLANSLGAVDIVALLRERAPKSLDLSLVPITNRDYWESCRAPLEVNFGLPFEVKDALLRSDPLKSLYTTFQEGTGTEDGSESSLETEGWEDYDAAVRVTRFTRARGRDTNFQRRERETPLEQAIAKSDIIGVFKSLTEGADVNLQDCIGKPTALHLAVMTLNVEIVKLVLDHGADINACRCFSDHGWSTPVQSIARAGLSRTEFSNAGDEIVRLLLENGADINGPPPVLRSAIAQTPFHGLIYNASLQTIKLALEAGAEFQHVSHGRCQSTPLQIACRYREMDVVELLLHYGADVNEEAAHDRRFTALQAAISRDVLSIELVEALVKQGANVNAEPQAVDGFTALQAAVMRQIPCFELVQMLLRYGADVNAKPCYMGGRTAIQAAASIGDVPIAQILLEAGADVNAPPAVDYGRTAIQAAAENGRLDMVQLLLEHDAVGDIENWTLLEPAIQKATGNGHRIIARILQARQDELLALPFEEVLRIVTASAVRCSAI